MVLRTLLVLLCTACIPKPGQPTVSSNNSDITVVTRNINPAGNFTGPLPEPVLTALLDGLNQRNLNASSVISQTAMENLAKLQVQKHRLEWLAQDQGGTDLILLIETHTEYFSQLSGRYRWTVTAELSLADPEDLTTSIHRSVEIPVFMQFHHEREAAVLEQASPALERELSTLLDAWLSAAEARP